MIAFHGSDALFEVFDASKFGAFRPGTEGHGAYLTDRSDIAGIYGQYGYEVAIPDGRYLDNNKPCAEQTEPARMILTDALSRQKGWPRRLDDACNQDIYSQVGLLLSYLRKDGAPHEPALIAAGYVGAKRRNPNWLEIVVFEPESFRIVSVSTQAKRAA